MTNRNFNISAFSIRLIKVKNITFFISLFSLLCLNCALLFPSLFDQNIQEDVYCSEAREQSKKCNQLEGQEKSACLEEANRLQQRCIEAIQNDQKPTDAIKMKNKEPLIMPEKERKRIE